MVSRTVYVKCSSNTNESSIHGAQGLWLLGSVDSGLLGGLDLRIQLKQPPPSSLLPPPSSLLPPPSSLLPPRGLFRLPSSLLHDWGTSVNIAHTVLHISLSCPTSSACTPPRTGRCCCYWCCFLLEKNKRVYRCFAVSVNTPVWNLGQFTFWSKSVSWK